MSAGNMNLTLTLTGRDNGARNLLRETERGLERTRQAQQRRAREQRPYALAGIRSEQQIRREITQTQAAYNRLAKSGSASHNDLARAATATRLRIAELNAELNRGVQTQGRFGRAMGRIGRVGAAAAAGATAGYMAVQPEMERYKTLDYRLRETTWAAHGETRGSDTQWLESQGLAQTRALIKSLVDANGGSTDTAIDTVQGMLANGMSWDKVRQNAQATHALAMASGENGQFDGAAAAKLARAFEDNGLDVARASRMAAQSGMQGTFEIANMVRELPSLLPDAAAAGFKGEAGLAYLLSALQSASNKSGTPDEAANNVKNVLQKALSADTTKRMDSLLKGQRAGVNWQQMVLAGQREGKNAVQVLGEFAQKLLSADKQFQAAKARADKGDEAAKQEMATMQAFMVSKLLPDMQARAGLNAMIDAKQMSDYFNGLMGNKTDVIGGRNAYMGNSFIARQEKAMAQKDLALQESKTFETLAEAETQLKSLSAEFPVATTALKAFTAAVTASALAQGAMSLLGKGGATAAVQAATAAAGRAGSGAMGFMRGMGGRLMGGLGLLLHSEELNKGEAEFVQRLQAAREAGGGVVGRAAGKMLTMPTGGKAAEPAEKLAPVITQQTAAYQTGLQTQTAAFQAALQADTAAVGGKLDAVRAALASANQTIQNNIAVHVDGRVVANEVSRHTVAMFGRGAGQ
ncbi:MAG: phage tail tape measure protein [Kingella denitrificans]